MLKKGNIADRLFALVALAMCTFHLYTVVQPSLDTVQQQSIHLCFALVLVFLSPLCQKDGKNPRLFTIITSSLLLAASVYSLVYILVKQKTLVVKIGTYTSNDLFVGTLLIAVLFIATYRTFGKALPILVGIFFLYGHFGYLVPGMLYHAGISWPRLIVSVTTNLAGVFGTVLEVSSTYIVLFMIFGGLLDASGAGDFFIQFAMSVGGKSRSGAAQAAVISSGLVGSINGSAVANVASTGVFTIPLMKDRGYDPSFAGAVEACASTGGMIMPPVMGVAAFVMAGITGIPYSTIALAALVPALLYYVAIAFSVHLRALKKGFEPLPDEKIPNLKKVLVDGIHFSTPLFCIVTLMIRGMSVMRAAFFGCVCLLVVVIIRETIRDPKYLLKKKFYVIIYEGFIGGAKSSMSVAAACAAMGIMTQIIINTGMATKIVFLIKSLAGEQMFMALFLTCLISIFFGMGVPTTASYVLVASLGAPVLIELGYPVLAIHLFIYYYAILANITPPIASAALVASQIAKAPYMKTGWTAVRLGLPGFILPFLFVYHPELLLVGSFLDCASVILSCVLGLFCMSCFFEGYFFTDMSVPERIVIAAASVLLVIPGMVTDLAGLVLFGLIVVYQRRKKKNKQATLAV